MNTNMWGVGGCRKWSFFTHRTVSTLPVLGVQRSCQLSAPRAAVHTSIWGGAVLQGILSKLHELLPGYRTFVQPDSLIFRRVRRIAKSYCYLRPSVRDNWAPTGPILTIFYIWIFFEKLSRKFKFY